MELRAIDPPRTFEVGTKGATISHCADAELEPDEQITFVTSSGTELDVVRKDWGYYAAPSLNGRLSEHGLRAVLAVGQPREEGLSPRMYLLLVERGHEHEFEAYASSEGMRVAAWLDDDEAVIEAARKLEGDR
jgi:hypothetical protein